MDDMDDMDDIEIADQINQIIQISTEKNLTTIRKSMRKELADERKKRAEFERIVYLRWKKALDLFELLILIGRDSAAEYNQQIRPFAVKENDLVFEVLTRIHAHACMVISATLSLLKSGYAADALARARTLHELDVTAQFILNGGNDLADKFLHYQVVESLKAARIYDKNYAQMVGYEPLDPETIPDLERQVNLYSAKFGEEFSKKVASGSYGWASEALKKKQPTFEDLEVAVGLSHMRHFYRLASEAVHASVKGILFNIGVLGKMKILQAGPSNAGLVDPGSMALTSFHRCTTNLLLYQRYMEEPGMLEIHLKGLVANKVMDALLKEANQAFLEAHQQLEREELERQAQ
jgi:Family of unknown function (DUF5677)